MKNIKLIALFGLLGTVTFTSCRKDFTCTCTTTMAGTDTKKTYNIRHQKDRDAEDACLRYENAARTNPGITTCKL